MTTRMGITSDKWSSNCMAFCCCIQPIFTNSSHGHMCNRQAPKLLCEWWSPKLTHRQKPNASFLRGPKTPYHTSSSSTDWMHSAKLSVGRSLSLCLVYTLLQASVAQVSIRTLNRVQRYGADIKTKVYFRKMYEYSDLHPRVLPEVIRTLAHKLETQ